MSQLILQALIDRSLPLTVAAAIRQEASGLTPTLVNTATVAEMDKYIDDRVEARVDSVALNIDTAAGRFHWPFDEASLSAVYPQVSTIARQEILRMQISTAADAVWMYVLGDLYSRAARRDDRFAEQAKYYIGEYEDVAYSRLPLEERGQAGLTEARVLRSVRGALRGNDREVENPYLQTAFMGDDENCIGEKDRERTDIWPLTYPHDRRRRCR